MSLEQVVQENTAALLQLIAALKNTPLPVADAVKEKKSKKEAEQNVATAPADTQATAEQAAAQESKAETSAGDSQSPAKDEPVALTVEQRAPILTAAVSKSGRDAVVALLKEFGAAKASEIPADKLALFDTKLQALAA